ncbi:glycosyltransferase family 4 protein [Lacisediminihabitans changchengi]|uniref:Glycosyltransferase family 4 protein n=1 Tax=Lacisediminihabitans changchengi TaxID=2787634 RepID=A0A934SH04_9MICO|nr:glycosyltransferase family 1 protein [Lacisediminihabitans changchengi]MBK4346461.1 glycosyltransferase family 4 protein [Lacisediminihabitans changchengi]MBK4348911.1 glycosyltransferase family 4 protein [Lacisediminihabitans changchengi]
MLDVALSMLTLVPGGMGGSETYARELTRQLATVDEVSATAWVPSTARGFSEGIAERVIAQVHGGPTTLDRLRALTTATVFARSIRRELASARVVHYPFTVGAPKPSKDQAFVQTLLDVQHLDLPQLFSRPELAYRRHYYEGAARRADAVITISEFAKTRMVELLGLDPAKIHVAHLAVDTRQFTPNLGPREGFVLYPARGWQHKNHARLVEAMRLVRAERPDIRLVLTGGALDQLGELPDWVERRGLVSTDELKNLYRSAAVLAFPSLYEGFGLPPLEAMASGCPVAASNAGSIPEVCGDAAVLFDPEDPEAIAAGILDALVRAPELTRRGLDQVQDFTWEKCRDVHVDVYRRVA